SGDVVMQSRLQALGYSVVTKVANSLLVTADANGKTLVVISGSASSESVQNKFRAVTVPALGLLVGVWDNMSLTSAPGATRDGAETQVTITNNGTSTSFHPVTAGRRGTITVGTTPGDFSYGPPSATKNRVARLIDDTVNFVVFAYDKGQAMFQLNAPARRVAMGFHNQTLSSLTPGGAALFDAAVNWLTKAERGRVVCAGPEQVINFGSSVALNGSASDDGLPGALTVSWSQVSGPGMTSFGSINQPVTTASFTMAGAYVLRLTASDGELTVSDDVLVFANVA